MNENLIGALVAILGALCLLGLRRLILSTGKSRKPKRVRDEKHESVSWAELRATTASELLRRGRREASSDRA